MAEQAIGNPLPGAELTAPTMAAAMKPAAAGVVAEAPRTTRAGEISPTMTLEELKGLGIDPNDTEAMQVLSSYIPGAAALATAATAVVAAPPPVIEVPANVTQTAPVATAVAATVAAPEANVAVAAATAASTTDFPAGTHMPKESSGPAIAR